MTLIRIATRRSALALAQSGQVAAALREQGCSVELVEVTTLGDTSPDPLTSFGGAGVFVAAVREAVLTGAADIAVHSMKDLPTAPAAGLTTLAVPERADVRDVLVASAPLAELPAGVAIGTGSPRRRAQVLQARPDLRVVGIRGNVDTRLAKVAGGELAGVVLARAGLDRLGLLDRITETLPVEQWLPAPAQGALAIEAGTAVAADIAAAVRALNHTDTAAAVTAERAALATLEAGCSAPVGGLATVVGDQISLSITVYAIDGGPPVHESTIGARAQADAVGRRAATAVLQAGADRLLGETV